MSRSLRYRLATAATVAASAVALTVANPANPAGAADRTDVVRRPVVRETTPSAGTSPSPTLVAADPIPVGCPVEPPSHEWILEWGEQYPVRVRAFLHKCWPDLYGDDGCPVRPPTRRWIRFYGARYPERVRHYLHQCWPDIFGD